jgi:long-chain acyl-CoA synthetase
MPTDVSSLRRLIYGASPISEALLRRAMKSLPNVQFYQGYGQTEMAGGVVVLRPEFHAVEGPNARLLRAAGRVSTGADIRIMDDNMKEVPRGSVGEIVAQGPTVMLGYWRKPEQTEAAIVNGWLRSGDAGYMDDEGFVFLVDRIKDDRVGRRKCVLGRSRERPFEASCHTRMRGHRHPRRQMGRDGARRRAVA